MITVKIKGLDKTIAHLKKLQGQLPEKKKLFLERLAEKGIELEESKMANIIYDGSHDSSVGVYWLNDDTLALAFMGEKVTFIEFGTGTVYDDQHEKASEFGFTRGTFGKGLGANPPWYFIEPSKQLHGNAEYEAVTSRGNLVVKTYGNPPNRVVYNTGKELRDEIVKIAKEVFSE